MPRSEHRETPATGGGHGRSLVLGSSSRQLGMRQGFLNLMAARSFEPRSRTLTHALPRAAMQVRSPRKSLDFAVLAFLAVQIGGLATIAATLGKP